MVVQRSMRDKSRIYEDHIALMQAEPDMIKTIAYLLAQTVALHFYEMCASHPRAPPLCTSTLKKGIESCCPLSLPLEFACNWMLMTWPTTTKCQSHENCCQSSSPSGFAMKGRKRLKTLKEG